MLFSMHQITTIEAAHNQITTVPKELFLMPNLEKVNLQSNCISSIEYFDCGFPAKSPLKSLNLQNNRIEMLPIIFLLIFHSLSSLAIEGNPFVQHQQPPAFPDASLQQLCAEKVFNRDEWVSLAYSINSFPIAFVQSKAVRRTYCDICRNWRVRPMQKKILFYSISLKAAGSPPMNFRLPFFYFVCCESEWHRGTVDEPPLHLLSRLL